LLGVAAVSFLMHGESFATEPPRDGRDLLADPPGVLDDREDGEGRPDHDREVVGFSAQGVPDEIVQGPDEDDQEGEQREEGGADDDPDPAAESSDHHHEHPQQRVGEVEIVRHHRLGSESEQRPGDPREEAGQDEGQHLVRRDVDPIGRGDRFRMLDREDRAADLRSKESPVDEDDRGEEEETEEGELAVRRPSVRSCRRHTGTTARQERDLEDRSFCYEPIGERDESQIEALDPQGNQAQQHGSDGTTEGRDSGCG
jgi:hypothetical protein